MGADDGAFVVLWSSATLPPFRRPHVAIAPTCADPEFEEALRQSRARRSPPRSRCSSLRATPSVRQGTVRVGSASRAGHPFGADQSGSNRRCSRAFSHRAAAQANSVPCRARSGRSRRGSLRRWGALVGGGGRALSRRSWRAPHGRPVPATEASCPASAWVLRG